MWVCDKCKFENNDLNNWCEKCSKERTYKFSFSEFALATSILASFLSAFILLAKICDLFIFYYIGGFLYCLIMQSLRDYLRPKYSLNLSLLASSVLIFSFIVLIFDFNIERLLESNIVISVLIFLLILLYAIIAFVLFVRKKENIIKNELDKVRIKDNEERERKKAIELKRYGVPDKIITSTSSDKYAPCVRVFLKSKVIEINGIKINFLDLLSYSLNVDVTQEAKTKTKSLIGRAVIGGALFGGVGALAGAVTSDKAIVNKSKESTIYVRTRRKAFPVIVFKTESRFAAEEFISILENIIHKNKAEQ